MKIGKKVLGLFGVVALSASSLAFGGSVVAQSTDFIDTSITVENTSCVDPTPTSFAVSPDSSTPWVRNPDSPAGIGLRKNLTLNTYVNTCLGQAWTITATMPAFTNGSNTIPAAALGFQGDTTLAGNVWRPDFSGQVPGTTGLSWGTFRYFNVPASDGLWTISQPITQGTANANGAMMQGVMMGVSVTNIPATSPGGLYTSDITFTFASEGP